MKNYNIARAGQQIGVESEDTIPAKLASGELRADDLGWTTGMTNWLPLSQLFPAGAAMPPPPAPSVPMAAPAYSHTAQPVGPKPSSGLVGAILVTLFCCLPLGIVAIVFAAQVDSKYSVGDYEGAQKSASRAKTFMWWGFGIGLAGSLAYLGLVFAGAMAGQL